MKARKLNRKPIAPAWPEGVPVPKSGREFDALSDEDKEKIWQYYDRDIPLSECRPLTAGEWPEIGHEVVPTQTGYERWAEIYDADDNPLILLEGEHVAAMVGDVSGLAVIDIGCGTGRHAVRLAEAGARVTAVDFSQAMLQRARMKAGAKNVTFLCHDLAMALPLAANTFDRVLCCLVADHIADLPKLFRELRRLCRTGGFVVFSVMHPAMTLRGVQARFIDPATGRRFSPASHAHTIADYVTAAVQAGLQIEEISEHAVDQELADRSPRARKYLGWPLLLLMRLR